ncbi:MAG: hypothetical protein WCR67_02015 [Bacilli bacterium]
MIIGTALIVLTWVLFVNIGLPVWAGIILTVVASFIILFGLLFGVYFFNIDSKLLAVVQKLISKTYDKRKRNRHLE